MMSVVPFAESPPNTAPESVPSMQAACTSTATPVPVSRMNVAGVAWFEVTNSPSIVVVLFVIVPPVAKFTRMPFGDTFGRGISSASRWM
jgi:hypothetical protein